MEKKLMDVLEGRYDNYILPFFWQHGEEDAVLVDEMEKIYHSGIRAVCVEARPHEGFCKDAWWEDFDLILAKAQELGMKVWLLDDKHFPTGYANGLVKEKYPHLRKWHLKERHVDVMGPRPKASLLVNTGNTDASGDDDGDKLLYVAAYKRIGNGEALSPEYIDLTACVKGNFLYWDVPEGCYRVVFLYKTRDGAGNQRDYIHMIDPASVDVLVEAVYEPHYQRYKEHFGKTFAGFFSDEPCFGNSLKSVFGGGPGFYDSKLGIPGFPLPWRDDLGALLSESVNEDVWPLLAGLWFDLGEKTSKIRTAYMDTITRLYRECFSMKLGEWCRARGVEYIGHIIEDMNAHARLGCSAGHFFRSLDGQDMAGIDVVLHQILPSFTDYVHTAAIADGKADPAFFHYILAKLAASHSHIQPRMKGRAMCEMYGAYGWGEGIPMMKWLTDHMLVRGINHFVPHAFSPKRNDPDCPPHFYANGENPQYRDFKVLMDYTNKMSHLLTGGRHIANAAILYHAEAEWSGGEYMYTEVPAKALYDEQIDFDILPADSLLEQARVEDGKLVVHQERFDCLVIPYAQVLPFELVKRLAVFADAGLCVIFLDKLPEKSTENIDILPFIKNSSFKVLPLCELTCHLIRCGYYDVRLAKKNHQLRIYHYEREGTHFFMLFNESLQTFSESVIMPYEGKYLYLDLLQTITRAVATKDKGLEIELSPYQSCVLVFSEDQESLPSPAEGKVTEECLLEGPFAISVTAAQAYPDFKPYTTTGTLFDMTGPEALPGFSGIMKYTTRFAVENKGIFKLDLGDVGETATVLLNGKCVGTRICRPYVFDITDPVQQGENLLEVEVANTLVHDRRDHLSMYLLLPPSGLLGPVRLIRHEVEGGSQ